MHHFRVNLGFAEPPLAVAVLAYQAGVITVQRSPLTASFIFVHGLHNGGDCHALECAFRNLWQVVAFAALPNPRRTPHPFDTGFIEQLITAAIDVIFSPIEALFAPRIDDLVELIDLPDIGFNSQSVSFGRRPARDAMFVYGGNFVVGFDDK